VKDGSGVYPSVTLAPHGPRRVAARFRALVEGGAELRPAGAARDRPERLLREGYLPRFELRLFDRVVFLTGPRQNPDIRFLVAYLWRLRGRERRLVLPRLFYKDVSLVWRVASHLVRSERENWIGKGDVRVVGRGRHRRIESDEATADLPLEIQTALEQANRSRRRIPRDDRAPELLLRRGPDDRIAPYRDFTAPRRRAEADPARRIHGGRPIARFTRRGDPRSLRIVPGYEPDFRRGVVERSAFPSRLYGGMVRRFRIVSHNREVQFLFFAGPRQVWIGSCQSTRPEITSYAVRPVTPRVDDDLLVPGYEYHYMDETVEPPERVSQIPAGFAGAPSPVDPSRADASAWLEAIPLVQAFRREVLGGRRSAARGTAVPGARASSRPRRRAAGPV